MAFTKYAAARVVRPRVSCTQWQNIRTASKTQGGTELAANLVDRASEYFGQQFDPKQFLLTHATIIASVDTYSPPGIVTGSVKEDGFRVNRRYSDFRITADTDKYINNNFDAWSRGVLLKSFQTFIGGHNFVEHVQIEDLSKGRIIDAVARDIGDSVYVDILIATDRKHKDLVAAIESGKMGTLSMGCTVDATQCTKCGHWAADETEMCPHIKYEKGNTFYDENGVKHIVAELCGHESIEPTGGVEFIEASWVEAPAFTGAVTRNVLDATDAISKQAQKVLSTPPPQWSEKATTKAASGTAVAQRVFGPTHNKFRVGGDEEMFLSGWLDEDPEKDGDETKEEKQEETPTSPLKEVEDEAYRSLMDRLKKRLKDELTTKQEESHTPDESTNENLNKLAARQRLYQEGLRAICRTASSDAALIDAVAAFNEQVGIHIPVVLYRVALVVGDPSQYETPGVYRKACATALSRNPDCREAGVLLKLGQLIFKRGSLEGGSIGSRHGGEKT